MFKYLAVLTLAKENYIGSSVHSDENETLENNDFDFNFFYFYQIFGVKQLFFLSPIINVTSICSHQSKFST